MHVLRVPRPRTQNSEPAGLGPHGLIQNPFNAVAIMLLYMCKHYTILWNYIIKCIKG